jgi:hypothetical protein
MAGATGSMIDGVAVPFDGIPTGQPLYFRRKTLILAQRTPKELVSAAEIRSNRGVGRNQRALGMEMTARVRQLQSGEQKISVRSGER